MISIDASSIEDAYAELLAHFSDVTKVSICASRLGPTLDLGPVAIDLAPGGLKLLTSPGRAINPYLAVLEACWVLAGRDDVATLAFVVERYRAYSDDGETLFGAYGRRLRLSFGFDQIENAARRLRTDSSSRRVFLSIASPEDGRSASLDVPCNISVMFRRRTGSLDMTVISRSNDVIFGLPYDLFVFSTIHSHVAALVGAPLGRHLHITNSMHLYERNRDLAERTLRDGKSDFALTDREVEGFMNEILRDYEAIASLNFDMVTSHRLKALLSGFRCYKANDRVAFESSLGNDWLGLVARRWYERPRSSRVATIAPGAIHSIVAP
jgi:thymidylate synthase